MEEVCLALAMAMHSLLFALGCEEIVIRSCHLDLPLSVTDCKLEWKQTFAALSYFLTGELGYLGAVMASSTPTPALEIPRSPEIEER